MPLHVIKAWYVQADHSTVVHFASFLPGGFTTIAVINPSERKQAKRTSVYSTDVCFASFFSGRFITAMLVNPRERKLAKRTFGTKKVEKSKNTP